MSTLHICFLLHMHQPDYRDPASGQPDMPWVRLHGIRSYTDIPWLMQQRTDTAFTLNLVPSLLDQLEQIATGHGIDPWLARSRMRPEEMSEDDRLFVIDHFFAVHPARHLKTGSRYRELLDKRSDLSSSHHRKDLLAAFSDTDIRDLQVLFHLSWFGFAARDMYPELTELDLKQRHYSDEDRHTLLELQQKVLVDVLPRLTQLADQGFGELSTSPATHPILPLLADTDCARRAVPDITLPPRVRAPEEAKAQITDGIRSFRKRFQKDPAGMWPSEGSVSPDVLSLMAAAGLSWFATDEEVGVRTGLADNPMDVWTRPWRFHTRAGPITGIFRNRNLSDRIGFQYHRMDTSTAVEQFVRELDSIRKATRHRSEDILVPIVLDGENPWEHYPESGRPFLEQLLDRLATVPDVQLNTLSAALKAVPATDTSASIHTGSWINAAFRIWIGHPETNLAWTRLGRAITTVRKARKQGITGSRIDKALHHLRAAEGSDWFWWYGDDFESRYKDRFDRLFHAHLTAVYEALDVPVPLDLTDPIHRNGTGSDTTPPKALIHPPMNGRDRLMDWRGGGCFRPRGKGGAMHSGESPIACLRFGWNRDTLFVRIEPSPDTELSTVTLLILNGTSLRLRLNEPTREHVPVEQAADDRWSDTGFHAVVTGNPHRTLALPLNVLNGRPGETIRLALDVTRADGRRYRIPEIGAIHSALSLPVDPPAWWWVE